MVFKIASWLGTVASIFGLVFSLDSNNLKGFKLYLFIISIIIIVILIALDIHFYLKNKPKRYKSTEKINQYMFNWISKGGKVAIFSRDLSWANTTKKMKDMLINKALSKELSVIIPKSIQLSDELQKHGAEIVIYDYIDYIPKSRFTIIFKDRGDSAVAIGKTKNKLHMIEEFSIGEHPAYFLSDDLIEIIKRTNEYIRNKK